MGGACHEGLTFPVPCPAHAPGKNQGQAEHPVGEAITSRRDLLLLSALSVISPQ